MNKLTEYLDIPLTQALAQSFGAKLEQLTAIDKLDAAQAILTAIAWGDIEQTHKPIAATVEEFGAVYPDAPNTDAFAAIKKTPSVAQRLICDDLEFQELLMDDDAIGVETEAVRNGLTTIRLWWMGDEG